MKWTPRRLGEIFEIQLGKMLSSAARTGVGSARYLRNANVQWGRFDLGSLATMDFDEADRLKFRLRTGDLLVCEGGEPGRCAVWEGQLEDCFYQKALHRLRPKEDEVDAHFGMYRLMLAAQRGEFAGSVTHSTIAHLPAEKLASLTFDLPPIAEQRRIVEVLRQRFADHDRARKALADQLDAARKLPLALVRESLKSDRQEMRLGEVLAEITWGAGAEWKSRPLWGATRAGLALAREPIGKSPERYKPVEAGCIFYNPMRVLIGSIAFVEGGAGIVSPDYVAFTTKVGRLHPRWFYHWLRSESGEHFIRRLARGAVRERILFKRLAEGVVSLPSWSSQIEMVKQMEGAPRLIEALKAQLDALDRYPAALLRDAFAGRL